MARAERFAVIRAYVSEERKRRQTIPTSRVLSETSCEIAGEFYNFVEVQLLYTMEGRGVWLWLQDPEILGGAYNYVVYGGRGEVKCHLIDMGPLAPFYFIPYQIL